MTTSESAIRHRPEHAETIRTTTRIGIEGSGTANTRTVTTSTKTRTTRRPRDLITAEGRMTCAGYHSGRDRSPPLARGAQPRGTRRLSSCAGVGSGGPRLRCGRQRPRCGGGRRRDHRRRVPPHERGRRRPPLAPPPPPPPAGAPPPPRPPPARPRPPGR